MGFNPLDEKGLPLEKQIRNWSDLVGFQYDKKAVDPYTRCRIILMNGIEVGAALFKHEMARHTIDPDLKRKLAFSRRVEQQQQKAVNNLTPGNESTLEVTIGYEQVAVDLTAWCAQNEPDQNVRQALDFALLEDFDHLYRYADMLDLLEGKKAEEIVGRMTEISPGRPTPSHHRHPFDTVRDPVDVATAAPITLMNIMSLVNGEQQTMNFYMNMCNRTDNRTLRGLYTEIGMVEEQHVTHYESLMDPRCTWGMLAVMHEYHECYLYHSFMNQEPDQRVRKIWERHLDMELGHLRDAVEICKKYEGRDASDFLPKSLPTPMTFQSNIPYVRKVLAEQELLTSDLDRYVPVDSLPKEHRFFFYQDSVNSDSSPGIDVIKEHIARTGEDYRFETGPHPIERFRARNKVLTY